MDNLAGDHFPAELGRATDHVGTDQDVQDDELELDGSENSQSCHHHKPHQSVVDKGVETGKPMKAICKENNLEKRLSTEMQKLKITAIPDSKA